MLVWLSVWSKVQTCIWPSEFHCHSLSCFSKIQIGFTFLVPAHPGSPGQRAVKRVCVCVCVIIQSSTALAGVRAGMSPLPGGRQHCVMSYGTRVPVAVTLVASYYTLFTFTFTVLVVTMKQQQAILPSVHNGITTVITALVKQGSKCTTAACKVSTR